MEQVSKKDQLDAQIPTNDHYFLFFQRFFNVGKIWKIGKIEKK